MPPRPLPQAGQTKPSGQRSSNRNAAQLVSSGKLAWNSLRDRALATGRPLAPAAGGRPRYIIWGSLGQRDKPQPDLSLHYELRGRFVLGQSVKSCAAATGL